MTECKEMSLHMIFPPVGEGHHDVEGGEHEHHVEQGPAVGHLGGQKDEEEIIQIEEKDEEEDEREEGELTHRGSHDHSTAQAHHGSFYPLDLDRRGGYDTTR